jgi:hypothetical protein
LLSCSDRSRLRLPAALLRKPSAAVDSLLEIAPAQTGALAGGEPGI